MILNGPRTRDHIFVLEGERILPTKNVKYLRVVLDMMLTFGEHVKYVVCKAEERTSVLIRIMPNRGGPGTAKRRILFEVIHSSLLCAALVWQQVLNIKKYRRMLEKPQRNALLRVARASRKAAVIQVIAGV
ncbi:uncharacterized protein [Diabrotica undecimpunctata]|uniref:uncharacterized protein n=1 Tax=Diabrotica undecimpunctata TaxID=50387 RepID=UPI003B63F22B